MAGCIIIRSQRGTQTGTRFIAAALMVGLLVPPLPLARGQATAEANLQEKMFRRVFGDAVILDSARVSEVKALPPGERLMVDSDGDGKNDEVWYIDTDMRHPAHTRPLLVRAIDEDGDLEQHQGPDLDSDLYLADWKADGTIDAVVDYQDNDGDDDVDEMGIYWFAEKFPGIDRPALMVFWSWDIGDDNLLWYDIAMTYRQHACQYRSHFSGDEMFATFALPEDSQEWVPLHENPFIFFDPDDDGAAEVAMRWAGFTHAIKSVRYSFDVDDDAHGRRVHDYDFSVTAIAPTDPEPPLQVPDEFTARTKIRGIPTGRFLQPKPAQDFARGAPWARVLLTWDEMNANTDADVTRDPHERWEGVIGRGSEHFPQVGAPPSSQFNKRNEVSLTPQAPLRLYHDPTDHRLHLKGANEGWLLVDYDLDGKADANYVYLDENQDGVFDRRRMDLNMDGQIEFDWPMEAGDVREFDFEFESLSSFYRPMLLEVLADSQRFIDSARDALNASPGTLPSDPVENFFLNKLPSWVPVTGLGKRMRETPAGARLYVDLVRDRLLRSLQERFGGHASWKRIESLYAAGGYAAAAEIIADELTSSDVIINPRSFRSFTHRIPITINNTGRDRRDAWPSAIPVADIRSVAADFNPSNMAVVAPERWLDWRQMPHQLDTIDLDTGPEISFLADLAPNASAEYFIYYSSTGKIDVVFPGGTDTIDDWYPPNIGWESERIAYRTYWGQFDFFGKKSDGLIFDGFGPQAYHDETEWGIDALLVGPTSGLGGLTLYLDDRAYPAQSHNGKGEAIFEARVLTTGPVRSAVEVVARNVVPTKPDLMVRQRCLIYAQRQETEVRVAVDGMEQEVMVAPGFVKLSRETVFEQARKGFFGAWGSQNSTIDEIGMGLIAPSNAFQGVVEEALEYRVKYRTSDGGKLRYWVIADWRRGRQFPIAPTAEDWRRHLRELSELLLNEPEIDIGLPENTR